MEGFDNKNQLNQFNAAGIADPSVNTSNAGVSGSQSKGALSQDAELEQSLNDALHQTKNKPLPQYPMTTTMLPSPMLSSKPISTV